MRIEKEREEGNGKLCEGGIARDCQSEGSAGEREGGQVEIGTCETSEEGTDANGRWWWVRWVVAVVHIVMRSNEAGIRCACRKGIEKESRVARQGNNAMMGRSATSDRRNGRQRTRKNESSWMQKRCERGRREKGAVWQWWCIVCGVG